VDRPFVVLKPGEKAELTVTVKAEKAGMETVVFTAEYSGERTAQNLILEV